MPLRCVWLALLLVFIALAFPVSVRAEKEEAFEIPEAEFFNRIHTVVLAPYSFPASFEESDTLLERQRVLEARLDTILVEVMRDVGLRVIPAAEAQTLWNQFTDSLGGLFDPVTGERDSTKYEIVKTRTQQELRARFQPDAWLFPKIRYVQAFFTNGHATWHGAKQKMVDQSALAGALSGSFGGGDRNTYGNVPALTLYVSIVDLEGRELYDWGGGLQVMARLHKGKFVDLEPEELFVRREYSEKAVEKALEQLVKAGRKHAKKS